MASTSSEYLLQTLHSKYLTSVIKPSSGPQDIPDDVTRMHTNRSETVTHELTLTTGNGVIVLFPNHPTNIIGAHYTRTTAGVLTFDRLLKTAQELPKNYDYGRKSAQVVHIVSSTLPAGLVQLSGTINALAYEGNLSEIADTSYNTILQGTSNPEDKVNSARLFDGLTVMSMPALGTSFFRLGDKTPSSGFTGEGAVAPKVYDSDSNLLYIGTLPNFKVTKATTNGTVLAKGEMNIDALGPLTVEIPLSGEFDNATSAVNASADVKLEVKAEILGLASNVVATQTVTPHIATRLIGGNSKTESGNVATVRLHFTDEDITEPIVQLNVTITVVTMDQINLVDVWDFEMNTTKVVATVHGGGHAGLLRPVAVAVYQGATVNSIMTVAGVSNYELIPNPSLLQNLKTNYSKVDPDEAKYYKMILANRGRVGLGMVMETSTYSALLQRIAAYTDFAPETRIPSSFSFGGLIKNIKDIAVPLISTIFPPAAPLANIAGGIVDGIVPSSASGSLRAASASGQLRRPSSHKDIPRRAIGKLPMEYYPSSHGGPDKHHPRAWPMHSMDKSGRTIHTDGNIAFFPVVMIDRDGNPAGDGVLYAAVPVKTDEAREVASKLPSYEFPNGKRAYGVDPRTYTPGLAPEEDVLLLPVLSWLNHVLKTTMYVPPLHGTSHQLAMILAANFPNKDHTNAAWTGGVTRGNSVTPVRAVPRKAELTSKLGLPLYGNFGDAPVSNTLEAVEARDMLGETRPIWLNDPPATLIPISMDGDDVFLEPSLLPPPPLEFYDHPNLDSFPEISPEMENARDSELLMTLNKRGLQHVATCLSLLLAYPQAAENLSMYIRGSGEAKAAVALTALTPSSRKTDQESIVKNLTDRGYHVPEEVRATWGGKGPSESQMRTLVRSQPVRNLSRAQAVHIATSMVENNANVPPDVDLVADWVQDNGAGPNEAQNRYIRANRRLPEPGEASNDAMPPQPSKVDNTFDGMMRYVARRAPGRVEELKDTVREIIEENTSPGKGPTGPQMSAIREAVVQLATGAPSAPRAKPAAPARGRGRSFPSRPSEGAVGGPSRGWSTAPARNSSLAANLFNSGIGDDEYD